MPVSARQPRCLARHADRVFRTRLDAQAAEDAARVVDLEADRELRVGDVGRIEPRLDLDHLGRAHGRAHVAGDALRLAVGALGQDVLAAVERCVVGARLLGVVGRERALPSGDPAPHVAQEDGARHREPAHDLGEVGALPHRQRRLVPVALALVRDLHEGALHSAPPCDQRIAAVTTRLTSASGSRNFQAKASTWS